MAVQHTAGLGKDNWDLGSSGGGDSTLGLWAAAGVGGDVPAGHHTHMVPALFCTSFTTVDNVTTNRNQHNLRNTK